MNVVVKQEDSRHRLLEVAAAEIYENGYQAASIATILTKTGLSKGALYHHFPKKLVLGYAVLDEIFIPNCMARWTQALNDSDPISSISAFLREGLACTTDENIRLGCPINNLSQEMSPIDEGFRQRINAALTYWRKSTEEAFKRGQQAGTVSLRINTVHNATFFVASMEGMIGLTKSAQNRELLDECTQGFIGYLEGLRP